MKQAGKKKAAKARPEAKPSPPAKAPRRKAAAQPGHEPAAELPKKVPLPAKKPAAPRAPVRRRRVVFPKDVYEANKEAIKAPFKEHGLKWQFLGEGKGRYHKEGVNVFVQFLDDGVHYSLWGEDEATVAALLRAWETLLGRSFVQEAEAAGEAATKVEEAEKESEALRLWRLQEPQPRPGEPDFFFKRRVDEWRAKKPGPQ